jgi:ferredoxin-NADP reductase
VVSVRDETARVRTIVFECPGWEGHVPGQHVDIRLTADDGYQAQRSYSIASAPEDEHLELTVERLDDGEVSLYLVDEVEPGDDLELRGPIGGYFVWTAADRGPLLLVGGGSGVVPFRSMLRHRAAAASTAPVRLLYSSRNQDEVIYRQELARFATEDGVDVRFTFTRQSPEGWAGYAGRIDAGILGDVAWPPEDHPLTFICGPTGFVETAATALVDLGHDPASIRTERFGPTGR